MKTRSRRGRTKTTCCDAKEKGAMAVGRPQLSGEPICLYIAESKTYILFCLENRGAFTARQFAVASTNAAAGDVNHPAAATGTKCFII